MSTFRPELHGKPKCLLIELWKGEGVRVTNECQVVCQGRSINDLVQSISDFLGFKLQVVEEQEANSGR